MGMIITSPLFQGFDANGDPLNGGLLYTYLPGTTTEKSTYTTRALAVENANPVVLNSRGEAIIYGAGLYKLLLKDSAESTIWTQDNCEFGIGQGSYSLYVDPSETDQGAAGNGSSLYDLLTALGTSKKATLVFGHTGQSNTTNYAVNTTFDMSSYTNAEFKFERGAVLVVGLQGDGSPAILTFPFPGFINSQPQQTIFDTSGGGSVAFTDWRA